MVEQIKGVSNIRYFDNQLMFYNQSLLNILLQDKTTKRNITWATDCYEYLGKDYSAYNEIFPERITMHNVNIIQPRVLKASAVQSARTKKRAEVFTPAWICNQINNFCDEEWFGRKDVFNKQDGTAWASTKETVMFPEKKTWKQYVDSKRLEITCGEAPYLVSRYDTATGDIIDIKKRIGILDRKLRIVNENTNNEADWIKWAIRAVQSIYGYEYQGDNLIIARINVLMTFMDYLKDRWGRDASLRELKKVANIIAWNLWQMDGLKGTVPYVPTEQNHSYQISMFDKEGAFSDSNKTVFCKIFDWRGWESVFYTDLLKEK